jgi:CMP-N-acetylneuraminic acid synthetase
MPVPAPHPWTAVIPLRGGSKGLPGKNTRALAGKPLYRHAVDLALQAGASRVLLSTDIPEILHASHPANVVPLTRPPELCGDTVPMAPVLLHALQAGRCSGPVVLLQATSPLRQLADVQAALQQLASGAFELVMSVTEADRGVLKWGQLLPDGRFQPLSKPEYCFTNRQSLPPVFKPNGAVYAFQAAWFLSNQGFVSERIGTVMMPTERSHDIDNLTDFERCEAIYLGMSDALSHPPSLSSRGA